MYFVKSRVPNPQPADRKLPATKFVGYMCIVQI